MTMDVPRAIGHIVLNVTDVARSVEFYRDVIGFEVSRYQPGGNINEEAGRAIFEPAHGTAPTIVGRDVANPIAMMLSGAMLYDFIGWRAAGDRVRAAVSAVVGEGIGTPDLGLAQQVGTGTRHFATPGGTAFHRVTSTRFSRDG